ncbi:hypothetical protein SeMB42_g01331 [Synchytrium endobioticum]|uniref:cytochrome-b5 reductase n=1 Tax=Synchytrium endobioticum TaxID=286115 RepID=A0A507DMW3_9FUNG|nr:hypothetical protein SeLEV6574_g01612 [Synchytrium endobioticum]TPX52575.1 hypothetical protein SeMB42_g01331 [Synchytrium endobioticum]
MLASQAFRRASRGFASTAPASLSARTNHLNGSARLFVTGATLTVGGLIGYGSYSTISVVQADAATPAVVNTALDPAAFKSFKLAKIEKMNHNTSRFSFALPPNTAELGLPVTSCLVIKFVTAGDGEESKTVVRPYTPVDGKGKGFFDLIVKLYPHGPASTHIHAMKVGDTLDMKGPIHKYILKPNEFKHIGMIAGGTGLTPMLQVITHLLAQPADTTKLSLIFANVTEDDILLKEYLDKTAKASNGRFEVLYTLDKPREGWNGATGFVNEDMIKRMMPKPDDKSGMVFVCGPTPMMGLVSGVKAPDYSQGELGGLLSKLGYEKKNVFKF